MRYDVVLCGLGGQGVLSVAKVIAASGMKQGFYTKQSEIHGMSQRGGAVVAHLRLADLPIASGFIPKGRASMILSMEPLESLRYLPYLSPEGILVTSLQPVYNVPDYPDEEKIFSLIRPLRQYVLVEAQQLARRAGSARATNMVMLGAACRYLPVEEWAMKQCIRERFAAKGLSALNINLRAFHAGRYAGRGAQSVETIRHQTERAV